MLCYFQDSQAGSSPVLSEADVEEGLTWHVRGPSRLYRLVMYIISVALREEQLRLYLIFTSIKMHMYGKQSTLSHKKTLCLLSSFSHQNTSKFLSTKLSMTKRLSSFSVNLSTRIKVQFFCIIAAKIRKIAIYRFLMSVLVSEL